MRNQDSESNTHFPDRRTAFDRTLLVIDAAVAFTACYTRFGAGCDLPGMAGAIDFVLLFVWANATESPACLMFWICWTIASIIYRLSCDKTEHSYSPGRVRLLWRWFSDRMAAVLEALIVLGIGVAVVQFNEPLGVIFLVSGVGRILNECLNRQIIYRRQIAYRNALREAENHAAVYRDMR